LRLSDLPLDTQEILNVMADLVSQNVGLREIPRGSESALELSIEAEVDVDLLVGGTIERTGRSLCEAASGLNRITEQYEPGVTVSGKYLGPGALSIIEYERNELDQLFLFRSRLKWDVACRFR
jgi:hypothetical protein